MTNAHFGFTLVGLLRQHWLTATLLGAVLIFLAVHAVWYIRPTRDITSIADLQARLTDGTPTIVKFYSNL